MKFRLVEKIIFRLIEGKQELIAKYGDKVSDFNAIYNAIPEKLKGYGNWVFKNVLEGEKVETLVGVLESFLKYKDRLETKDINKYSSKKDIEQAIQYAQEKGSKKEKLYDAELVYEDDKVKIVSPRTHEASRHYGTGTNWCTATANSEYFKQYVKKGKLFYILPKNEEKKYAIFSKFKLDHKAPLELEGYDKYDNERNAKRIIQKFGLNPTLFSAILQFDYKTKEGIERFLKYLNIKKYTIHEDLTVDVNENVVLDRINLSFIPITFGKIKGSFNCEDSQLTSLEGAPQTVGGGFDCGNNKLTSLEGAPRTVGGNFHCANNQLTSLEGAPQRIGGDFYCVNNQLTSLEGCPQTVGGFFDCSDNKLTSLEGAPQRIGGGFDCGNNKLTSLEGAPRTVGGNFYCGNNKLTSLEGAPRTVGGNFHCGNNKLTSLEGAPQTVGGGFFLSWQPNSS